MKKLIIITLLFLFPFFSEGQKVNIDVNQTNYGLYIIDTGYVEFRMENGSKKTEANTKFPIYIIVAPDQMTMANKEYHTFKPSLIEVIRMDDGINYVINGSEVMLAYPSGQKFNIYIANTMVLILTLF